MTTQLKKFRAAQTEQFSGIKGACVGMVFSELIFKQTQSHTGTVHTFAEDKTKEIETLTERLDSLQALLGAAVSQIGEVMTKKEG